MRSEKEQEAVDLVTAYSGIRKASAASGIPYTTLQNRYKAGLNKGFKPIAAGVTSIPEKKVLSYPGKFIFTCAQSNTYLNKEVWENIKALAELYEAKIYVSTFTYDLASYRANSVKRGKAKSKSDIWYDPEIEPYILDENVVVAPGLTWCGELNILPTAVRPLTGFESYTGRNSGIFPHAKISMASIPSAKYEPTKFNYTTGCITKRNYIAKTAGFKANFHHSYGGLLVEVNSNGDWFCRQLNADKDNVIYDLTNKVENGKVTGGQRVEAINWGDIHVGTVSDDTFITNWGFGGIIQTLKPKYQFMHDVLDFRVRNHHNIKNHHSRYAKYISGNDRVASEIQKVLSFITGTNYVHKGTRTIVVDSNHDNAFEKWLREADYRSDPPNAEFFLEAQAAKYRSIRLGTEGFNLIQWALEKRYPSRNMEIEFLSPDESFIICRKEGASGIECGMHGHHGANGSRGSLRSFAKMGRKCNVGHTHSVGIESGAYCAGITGDLDQVYNVGPSSWSVGHIITYPNGKRTIINVWNNKWRVE